MAVAKCSIIRVAILGLLMQRYQQRVGGLVTISPIAYKFHGLSRVTIETVVACCMLASDTLPRHLMSLWCRWLHRAPKN